MFFRDYKHLLSPKNGMNIYRGCTHGCIYCDSRSLCYQMDHDFENIEIKKDAPKLLEEELSRRRKPCMIVTGAMCDPYIQLEKTLKYTRECLEIIERKGFGIAIQTKSADILRDIDILSRINEQSKCVIEMTLTTYDEDLCRLVEPNVSTTRQRFDALKTFRDAGIPTVVWLSPILPFINDTKENLEGILEYCDKAGVRGIINFGFGMTLREGSREYFYAALDKKFPGIKQQYISTFGNRYECVSPNNFELMNIFNTFCRQKNIMCDIDENFNYLHTFTANGAPEQLTFL